MPVAVLSISATFPTTLAVATFDATLLPEATKSALDALTVICTFPARDIDDIDPIATH